MNNNPKVSFCIASYNMKKFLAQAVSSCFEQTVQDFEVIIYDDCSTDGTETLPWLKDSRIVYKRGETNVGVGEAFMRAIELSKGEYVILLCADDIIFHEEFVKDVMRSFSASPTLGHVSRYYHQFIDGDPAPVRAWRTSSPLIQSNNPSGLAYRREALKGCQTSNKMFIETTQLTAQVLKSGWDYKILKYDAVSVRVHSSTSTQPGYYLKHRVSSPVMDWWELGEKDIAKDYVSFLQIKNGFRTSAVLEEVINFIKLRPINLLHPSFWFFAIIALTVPRKILRKLPHYYRITWGKWTTGIRYRP